MHSMTWRATPTGSRRTSDSQTRITTQPASESAKSTARSRATFREIFSNHHAVLVGNIDAKSGLPRRAGSSGLPCHISPSTKIAMRRPRMEMSGRPMTVDACSRYRRPSEWRVLRRAISAFESFPRTARIIRCVVSGLRRFGVVNRVSRPFLTLICSMPVKRSRQRLRRGEEGLRCRVVASDHYVGQPTSTRPGRSLSLQPHELSGSVFARYRAVPHFRHLLRHGLQP